MTKLMQLLLATLAVTLAISPAAEGRPIILKLLKTFLGGRGGGGGGSGLVADSAYDSELASYDSATDYDSYGYDTQQTGYGSSGQVIGYAAIPIHTYSLERGPVHHQTFVSSSSSSSVPVPQQVEISQPISHKAVPAFASSPSVSVPQQVVISQPISHKAVRAPVSPVVHSHQSFEAQPVPQDVHFSSEPSVSYSDTKIIDGATSFAEAGKQALISSFGSSVAGEGSAFVGGGDFASSGFSGGVVDTSADQTAGLSLSYGAPPTPRTTNDAATSSYSQL